MAQTKEGAQKAKEKQINNLMELYSVDYEKAYELYKVRLSVLASKGGKASGLGGFHANPELARRVGAIGGSRSKRGYKLIDGEYVKRT